MGHQDQMTHFIDLGLVEPCDESGQPLDPGRAWECVSALIACGLPEGGGAPRARELLRAKGFRYSNDTICSAVKLYKSGAKYEAPK